MTELALGATPDSRARAPAEPSGARVPSAERDGLVADDQGAILVLGIFMCVGLAGMLSYSAGVGDAIIYRERMQEAADATAFSGAVLLARGMNLIVFLNLIMACVLAVRVALKVLLIISVVLEVVFTILSCIPYMGAAFIVPAEIFTDTTQVLNEIIENTRDAINNVIEAINKVQTVLGRVIPPAAVAGAYQVGTKYKPMIDFAIAGGPATLKGLPIDDDRRVPGGRQPADRVDWQRHRVVDFGRAREERRSRRGR